IKLWDTANWAEKATLTGHEGPVNQVAFSPDGLRLASASGDKTARIWNVGTRAAEGEPVALPSEVRWVTFSPDGKSLASATDGLVKVWDLPQKRERCTLPGSAAGLAFGSRSDQLAVGACVWDLSVPPRRTHWLGRQNRT